MANDEHVALLKQGVAAWNAWRNENPDIVPDLRREHLSGMNLTEANLIEAKRRPPTRRGTGQAAAQD
jgi:hypothetical protein